jgi:hypothetical protein
MNPGWEHHLWVDETLPKMETLEIFNTINNLDGKVMMTLFDLHFEVI